MKVSPNRIPRPPQSTIPHNSAPGDTVSARHSGAAYPNDHSMYDNNTRAAPGITATSMAANSGPLPLRARRRVKSGLAGRRADAEFKQTPKRHYSPGTYEQSSMDAMEAALLNDSPRYQSSIHDPAHNSNTHHQSGYPPQESAAQPPLPADSPIENNPVEHNNDHAEATAQSRSRSSIWQSHQGPYRAVVVFLLLLMALVIMAMVYQLFFRPNQSSSATDRQPQAQDQNILQEPINKKVAEAVPQDAQEDTNERQTSTAEPLPAEPLNENPAGSPNTPITGELSQASPVSMLSPDGEEVSTPRSARPSPELNTPVDENKVLVQSKVGGIGYWIQVGAFSSRKNANNIQQQLAQSHLSSEVQEGESGSKKVYRVRIGLYTSKEEAKRIQRQLKNIGKPFADSIIIKTDM